jgi:hypothetical protein
MTKVGVAGGFGAGVVGVESSATVWVPGEGMGSCCAILVSSVVSEEVGASEVDLLGEGVVIAALPGEGLELFEESVVAGSVGMGVVCD